MQIGCLRNHTVSGVTSSDGHNYIYFWTSFFLNKMCFCTPNLVWSKGSKYIHFNHILLNACLIFDFGIVLRIVHAIFSIYIIIHTIWWYSATYLQSGCRQTTLPTHSYFILSVSFSYGSVLFYSIRFDSILILLLLLCMCCVLFSAFYSFNSIQFDSVWFKLNRFNSIRSKVQTNRKFITFHHLMLSSDFPITFALCMSPLLNALLAPTHRLLLSFALFSHF